MKYGLKTLLTQADALRFKLLAFVGKDEDKKSKIIQLLQKDDWILIDVENELLTLNKELDSATTEMEFEITTKIKEWFNAKPNKIILTNASILYHDVFLKISPIGAFKYNSRNKNCVLFLEDEQKLGNRLYYGSVGKSDYYDQEINDIILVRLEDIDLETEITVPKKSVINDLPDELPPDAIGHLFSFRQIKDVIDIDADLKGSERQKELVSSFIISESLERQIVEFFEDLEKPIHKARTVIGNYGSGKSHLVGFLVSLVENPNLVEHTINEKIKAAVRKTAHKFLTVQFELQSGQVELKRWFYGTIRKQLKSKYNLEIPAFDPINDYDDKENIIKIIEFVKNKTADAGLLVVIDEISDFLATKQKENMKADLQFLRVLGQVCQNQDLMFIGSMQEDVFSSPKFKDVAGELGRIGERFQNIIIHREDIKRVISQRIVPKEPGQKHKLEQLFAPFAEKIEDVSRNLDNYIDLFPLTPFLIELFSDLPYFEKRGVIQFAMAEIKYLLNEKFPCFITFDRIYDLLENNPNKRNLEEIYEISRAMQIVAQKINLLDRSYQTNALRIVKGLAVYSLWDKRESGATIQELTNHLMLLPDKKILTATDNIALIIKKIREVTEGEYIKIQKEQSTGIEYFRFDTKAGIDPEQKISQKAASVSNDEVEYELFIQLRDILDLEPVSGQLDIFEDECEWRSTKSFRRGYIIFVKKDAKLSTLPVRDYALIFISPFIDKFNQKFANHQLTIKIDLKGFENIELLKEIVAIKALIGNNFQKHILFKKLDQRINGYEQGSTPITGFKYRLSKLLLDSSSLDLNGTQQSFKAILSRLKAPVPEIIDEIKTTLLDQPFNEEYPLHPVYSMQLSSKNIITSLNPVISDLLRGDFTNMSRTSTWLLQSLNLLDSQEYPDLSQSRIIQRILDILKNEKQQVTEIDKELVLPLSKPDYGLEAEIVHFHLVLMTILGKVYLQVKGGDRIDINNVKEKLKTLAAFETIAYIRLQEDFSYDFAARLLNALGLNGARIQIEKERLNAFKEYKERIHQILQDILQLDENIKLLKQKERIYINLNALENEFTSIQTLNFSMLNIQNHQQFGNIESYSTKLDKITIALNQIRSLNDALDEYKNLIEDGISYMNQALDLLQQNPLLVMDEQKLKTLGEYRDDVLKICQNFDQFSDRSQRNPVKGKIQQFKKIYIYDFYLPAHEKYVGKKVNWGILSQYQENPTFKKISILGDLACISKTTINQKVLAWNELKQYQCVKSDLEDALQKNVFCQHCLFPKKGQYQTIPVTLNRIEDEIENLYNTYENTILKEMRSYRDNIQYLDTPTEKQMVQKILDSQKLPEFITLQMVQTINKLFKEIEIEELSREELIDKLLSNAEMITIEDLRKRFMTLVEDLKKNRPESEIRIKLK